MGNELRDGLAPRQRAALEEFHRGHISAGELQRRLAATTGGAPPAGQPVSEPAKQGTAHRVSEPANQATAETPLAAAGGADTGRFNRAQHTLLLLALALLLGVSGAAIAAGGVAGGNRRSGHRVVTSHARRQARRARHVGTRTVHHATPTAPLAAVSRPHRHKAAGKAHTRPITKRPRSATRKPTATSTTHQAQPPASTTTTNTTTTSTPTTSGTSGTTSTSTSPTTSTTSPQLTSTSSATTVAS